MRVCELRQKEVINIRDGQRMGYVADIEFDETTGCICQIIVPGPGKYLGFICKDYEFCIPWVKIIRIGPDIILVDLDEASMKRKL